MSRYLQNLLTKNYGLHQCEASGVIVDRWKLRQREYTQGVVFNVTLHDCDNRSDAPVAVLYFRDEQAVACSFLEKGDRVAISSFIVEANPAYSTQSEGCPVHAPLQEAKRILVCGPEAVITVQSMQDGDPLELILRPGKYDQPEARVCNEKRSEGGKVYFNSAPRPGVPVS